MEVDWSRLYVAQTSSLQTKQAGGLRYETFTVAHNMKQASRRKPVPFENSNFGYGSG